MGEAGRATEAGMRAGIAAAGPGVSENDIAAEIHHAMFKAGGEYPAVSPFVASGPRCAVGHATWEGRILQQDEPVFLEVGGCVQRYHTAMIRVAYLGEPTPVMREAEGLVREATEAAMEAMRPGAVAHDVDAICQKTFARNTFGASQSTRSAYSIGIGFAPDWGEGNILSIQESEQRRLEANMTFHLIPWIQVPGKAGIGTSETVVVTDQGAQPLIDVERQAFFTPSG